MSYFERHIAPVSLKPISFAPLLLSSTKRTYSLRIGMAIWCHPNHAFFNSSGSRLLPMISSSSGRLRHLPLSPSGQYLPLPYSPSIDAVIFVSSLRSAGSFGAGRVSASLISLSFRLASGKRSRLSYFLDCSASSVVAAMRFSFASAASNSVSSVIKVLFTQSARPALIFRSSRRFSASARNLSASPFGEPEDESAFGLSVHDIRASPTPRRKKRLSHNWRL